MRKYNGMKLFPILAILILGTIPAIYSDSSEEYYMLTLINKERVAQGLEPLTMNSALSSAARLHSQDMINRSFFNHVNPDGLTPSDRARNAGYSFIALAENICGNPSIDAGHSSLMGSPSHRINILNPAYKEVGIGIVDGGPYGKMITQLFGSQPGNNLTPTVTTYPEEPQGKPDLVIKSIDFSGQAEPLKQILIKITLTNSGKKNAGNFVFAVFEGPPENGNQLGKINISSLYVGQNVTANFNWTPPKEGNYLLYFIADHNNNIQEENENNNVGTFTLSVKSTNSNNVSEDRLNNTSPSITSSKPDLHVSKADLSYNQIVYEGTPSLVSFRIRNIGKSTAFGVPVKVYVNGNLKSSPTINQLIPSSYTDMTLYLTLTELGENSIEIKIDPDNIIDEVSKSNNYVNFNIKSMPRENKSITTQNTNQNNKLTPKDIDLLIYPYYITIEEENEYLSVKAKIKNKSNIKVENVSVIFYENDYNSSNNIFLEKIYISLGPEEITEEIIKFIPTTNPGEVIVVIDQENKINENDESNNVASKMFSRSIYGEGYDESYLMLNTTPGEVNISDLIRISMKVMDNNVSNAYLYYKYEKTNSSFFILKMDKDENNSYSIEVDPSGHSQLFYFFEVDTGTKIIKSPSEESQDLYSVSLAYQKSNQDKRNPSLFENIRRLFGLTN
ncbi:MAG: hypothetical protein APG12_01602 [Candidatus Methanofastidiosum methylothiophilum]|uniref:Cysteine-rich secretory protein family protein n=1 Tax=Candidatus Methanofastidiosum methylothiophilum TaxID=1705564 RepID=A0A150IWG7_9EURY|nr:MAG: hypothetical protein APG10_00004 [Candidatus Methanofastidiosum methylthiophilus]KYC46812.1 MAG: hypothetical protein APG11_01650 [Candidatus Methanofastidiosum methylthiophilus]KYC49262.1 MAG: hypothetical protein APG12_01602 [Candidatus Methanofastidiosum methylthiophilus]